MGCSIVPARGFVHDYVRSYIQGSTPWLTDAPVTYHVATAYALLSMACMDRMRLPWGGVYVPPNLFTMLVGASTVHRKTTAVKLALHLARMHSDLAMYLGPNEVSAEGLVKTLQELDTLLLAFPEMGDFFVTSNTWGGRLKPLLNDLADSPAKYTKRLAKEAPVELVEPKVAVLGAVNAAMINEIKGTSLDWQSGFFARFLIVCPGDEDGNVSLTYRSPTSVPIPMATNPVVASGLAARLSEVRGVLAAQDAKASVCYLEGMEPGALQIYTEWFNRHSHMATLNLPVRPDRLQGAAMKCAALLTADLSGGQSRIISEEAMAHAVAFADVALKSYQAVWGSYLPEKDGRDLERVLRLIRDGGAAGMDRATLIRRAHTRSRLLNELVDTLKDGELILVEQPGPRKGLRYFARDLEQ